MSAIGMWSLVIVAALLAGAAEGEGLERRPDTLSADPAVKSSTR